MISIEQRNVAFAFIRTGAEKVIDDFPRSVQEIMRYTSGGINLIGDVFRRSQAVNDFARNEKEAEIHFLAQENRHSFPRDRIYIYKLFWLLGQQLAEPIYNNKQVNRENPFYMRDVSADVTGTLFYLVGICDDVIDEFHLTPDGAANFLDDVFQNVTNAIDEHFTPTFDSIERRQKLLDRGKMYWQERLHKIERSPQQSFDQKNNHDAEPYKNFALFYSRLFGSRLGVLFTYAERDLGMNHASLEINRDTFLYILQKLMYGEIDSLSPASIAIGSYSYAWYVDVSRRKSEPITDALIAVMPDWQPLLRDHKHKWAIAHRFRQLIELIPAQVDDDILDFDSDINSQQPTIFIYRLIEEATLARNIQHADIAAAKASPLLREIDIGSEEEITSSSFLVRIFGTDNLALVEEQGKTLAEEWKKLAEEKTDAQERIQLITQIIKQSGVVERCISDILDKRRVAKIRKRARYIERKGNDAYLRLKIAELYQLYHFYRSVNNLYRKKKT